MAKYPTRPNGVIWSNPSPQGYAQKLQSAQRPPAPPDPTTTPCAFSKGDSVEITRGKLRGQHGVIAHIEKSEDYSPLGNEKRLKFDVASWKYWQITVEIESVTGLVYKEFREGSLAPWIDVSPETIEVAKSDLLDLLKGLA